MNKFEGLVNTYPINVVRPYDSNKGGRVCLPNSTDRASLNSALERYLDDTTIRNIVYSNPEITRLLSEKGIPLKINLEGFRKNVYNHSLDTRNTAVGIYNHLPSNIKQQANLKDIADGALLHDYGKILIPENILMKNNKLSPKEEDIMHLHSTLSYEMLKNQGINDNVLKIVKYHHQNPSGNGYPDIGNNQGIDLNTQIVSLADKYSALREKRSYKRQMSEKEALNILYNEINKGVNSDVYNALDSYIMSKQPNTRNTVTLSNYLDTKNVSPQINRGSSFYA